MSVAPKLLNCRVNMSYFAKNYKVLTTYFKSRQMVWKHQHLKIVIFTFLEWSICLNCCFVIKPISRDFF